MKPIVNYLKFGFVSVFLIVSVVIITNCTSPERNQGKIKISLTDTPDSITALLVDIKYVDIHYAGNDSSHMDDMDDMHGDCDSTNHVDNDSTDQEDNDNYKWIRLNTVEGVYNIAELQNGLKEVIANDELDPGYITQIRLILGDNNQVVMNGDTLDLFIPGSENTGIKINYDDKIIPDTQLNVLLDFDIKESVFTRGNGKVMCKPVIKIKSAER